MIPAHLRSLILPGGITAFALIVVAVLLVSCAAPVPKPGDVSVSLVNAEDTQVAGRALLTATAIADNERARDTVEAFAFQTTQTVVAMNFANTEEAQVNAAATKAYYVEETRQVGLNSTADAERTATAGAQTSQTAWVPTATVLWATQEALIRNVKQDEYRQQVAAYTIPVSMVMASLAWAAIGATIIALLVVSYRRFAPVVERRLSVINRPSGVPLLLEAGEIIDTELMTTPSLHKTENGYQNTATGDAAIQAISVSGKIADNLVRHGYNPPASPVRAPALPSVADDATADDVMTPVVRVLPPSSVPWLDEVEQKLMLKG